MSLHLQRYHPSLTLFLSCLGGYNGLLTGHSTICLFSSLFLRIPCFSIYKCGCFFFLEKNRRNEEAEYLVHNPNSLVWHSRPFFSPQSPSRSFTDFFEHSTAPPTYMAAALTKASSYYLLPWSLEIYIFLCCFLRVQWRYQNPANSSEILWTLVCIISSLWHP